MMRRMLHNCRTEDDTMHRRARPDVEFLEAKALLSGFTAPAHSGWAAFAPAGSPIAYTLTTDRSSYAVGQPVRITLTMTNVSDHNVPYDFGPADDAFTAGQGGVVAWDSSVGLGRIPIGSSMLSPHETERVPGVWYGNFNEGAPAHPQGPFQIRSAHDPALAATVSFRPGPIAYSLTTDRAVYAPGGPVTITLTETNRTDHPVTTYGGPSLDGFTVSQGGREVWRSNEGPQPLAIQRQTIPPHRSIRFTATWHGQFDEARPADPLGPFLVRAERPSAPPATISFRPPPPG